MLKDLESRTRDLPQKTGELACLLRKRLHEVPALPLLACATYEVMAAQANGAGPSALVAEYPTMIYLTNAEAPRLTGLMDQIDVLAVHTAVNKVIADAQFARDARYVLRQQGVERENLESIKHHALTYHLNVRNPALRPHVRDQLRGLFAPFDLELREIVGMTINEILNIEDAMCELLAGRLSDRAKHYRAFLTRLRGALATPDNFQGLLPEEIPIVEWARADAVKHGLGERAHIERLAVDQWLWATSPDVFIFEPADIAEQARVSSEAAQRFLETFSLAFASQRPKGDLPTLFEPLEEMPLINLGGDRWFAHLSQKLVWAIRPRIERLLKSAQKFSRYERHRATYLEQRSIDLIKSTSRHARAWRGLKYTFDDGAGPVGYDLDGLVVVDSTIFLIEAKAGTFSLAARRGAESTTEDLDALVAEPHAQATRALRFVRSAPEVEFNANGERIVLRRDEIRRALVVTTTLESLSAYVTQMRALIEAGIMEDGTLSWSVVEFDLRVITELVEGVGQFVHYLDRRLALEKRVAEVRAADELDFFGYYLSQGLYFDVPEFKHLSAITLDAFSRPIEDYYAAHLLGIEPVPSRPQQPIPAELRQLMLDLEAFAPASFIEAVHALLDLDGGAREMLAEQIASRRQRASARSFAGIRVKVGDTALVYAATIRHPDQPTIDDYTAVAKYELRCDRAVGIFQSVRDRSALRVAVLVGPWAPDERMVELRARVLANIDSNTITRRAYERMKRRNP